MYYTLLYSCLLALCGCHLNPYTEANESNWDNHSKAIKQLQTTKIGDDKALLSTAKLFLKEPQAPYLQSLIKHINPKHLKSQQLTQLYHVLNIKQAIYHNSDLNAILQTISRLKPHLHSPHLEVLESYERSILLHLGDLPKLTALWLDQYENQGMPSHELWQHLQSPAYLTATTNISDFVDEDPWLELLGLLHNFEHDDQDWHQTIRYWQEKNPKHPGHTWLNDLENIHPIRKIGFLLPQTGPYQHISQQIQEGFVYQQLLKKGFEEVRFYDSSHQPIDQLYEQAIQDGMDLIVGPFEKDQMELLKSTNLKRPTIFLQDSASHFSDHAYFLDLSRSGEIKKLAQHAITQGYSRALILSTNEEWSQKGQQNIEQIWLSHDLPQPTSIQIPPELYTYAEIFEEFLGIKAAKLRVKSLETSLHQTLTTSFDFQPSFDVIFLLTNAKQTKLLNALIHFYGLDHVGVFSTSMINHQPIDPTNKDQLKHLIFSDSLYYQNNPGIDMSQRLKHLGHDLYYLTHHFNRFNRIDDFVHQGRSGLFSLRGQHWILEHQLLRYHRATIEPIFTFETN